MSGESTAAVENAPPRTHLQVHTAAAAAVAAVAASSQSKKKARRGSEWEILEGLKEGQCYESRPESFNGYLHKKRKWPLKGWHKVKNYKYIDMCPKNILTNLSGL